MGRKKAVGCSAPRPSDAIIRGGQVHYNKRLSDVRSMRLRTWQNTCTLLLKNSVPGSSGRTRTYNQPVNSRPLCQLSYRGMNDAAIIPKPRKLSNFSRGISQVLPTSIRIRAEWMWHTATATASAASSGRGMSSRLSNMRTISWTWCLSAPP